MGLVVNGCVPLFYNYVGCRPYGFRAMLLVAFPCFIEGAGGLVIKFRYGLKWMSWFVFESVFSLLFSAVCLYSLCL